MSNKKIVLVTVAHTDDESFGCGGLIKKLSKGNYDIYAVSFTNGVTSKETFTLKEIESRQKAAKKAAKILGFKWIENFNLPDNELDKVSLLSLVKKIEIIKKKINPNIIITHNYSDLNIDHRKIFEATLTAFRPVPKSNVEKIITFEVPSSTDFRMLKREDNFVPNFYVNIEKFLKYKINAIKCYKKEFKKSPHSRSINGIKNLSKIRGNQSGIKYAEAYEIIREILQ